MTVFRRLALATTLTTIGVIGVGGLVRATGSGEGCPEWPRCFGRWIPPLQYHAIIEYSHRAIGAVAITLLCITAVVAVVKHRRQRALMIATLIAVGMIFVQAGLGAIVVNTGLNPTLVTIHIATAMILVGLLVWITVSTYCLARTTRKAIDRSVLPLALAAAGATFVLIAIGAYVRGEGAGLAFSDWPLMKGTLLPHLAGSHEIANFVHRAAALAVGVVLGAFVWRANRAQPREAAVRIFANIAAVAYIAQAVVGGLQVTTKLAAPPVVAHVVLASLLWASLVAAVSVAYRASRAHPAEQPSATESSNEPRRDLSTTLRAYVALTKPRIILLLLITTIPTMLLAKRGWPSAWLMTATVLGGTLAAAAANTINMYLDRDIDAVMARTRSRPLPAHSLTPARALTFGIFLQAGSFFFMAATVNLLAAFLTQSAVVFYIFVYTLSLKRSTPQNIVIGGAAGAVPVLVGWAAVTGRIGWPAVVLFSIIFFWTPAHFWALAVRYADDYRAAGVPMLPVVAGLKTTQRQIMVYSVVTVAVTLLLLPVARMGTIYVVAAGLLGAWFLRHAVRLWRTGTAAAALGVFRASIGYLALLFVALGLDAVIHIAV